MEVVPWRTLLLAQLCFCFMSLVRVDTVSASVSLNNDENDEKFPPCKTCKLYVESFLKGLEKTSKGNFAGGDTAWEESNQKNYAKSEVRLIEIQEKLCSEVPGFSNQCHDFSADIENEIEEWWFKAQHSGEDLFTWLCINQIKRCCPVDHYGPDCKPCKGYPSACFGNGKCKGNGTRKGNGHCICNKEYRGELCDDCNVGYFLSYKDEKAVLCSKCHTACEGGCTAGGPKGCNECKSGWEMDKDVGCFDLNECTKDGLCKENEFCVNTEGSYRCMQCDLSCAGCHGDGPDMCNQCAHGYTLQDHICVNTKNKSPYSNEYMYRYMTYLGLCIATYIIFQKNVLIASIIGVFVAIYVSVSEYILNGKAYYIDSPSILSQNFFGE